MGYSAHIARIQASATMVVSDWESGLFWCGWVVVGVLFVWVFGVDGGLGGMVRWKGWRGKGTGLSAIYLLSTALDD